MNWANEGINQLTTDADELSFIAAGPTELQDPAQNLHGLLSPYHAGSEYTPILDNAHQNNELLPQGSQFREFFNEQQPASAAVCTQLQYPSNQQVSAVRADAFSQAQPQLEQSGYIFNSIFNSQFDDLFGNRAILPAQTQLDYPDRTFNQQSQTALSDQLRNNDLSPQQQPGYIDDKSYQQSDTALDSQLLNQAVLPAQPQPYLLNRIFGSSSYTVLSSQIQSTSFLPGQPQPEYLRVIPDHTFSNQFLADFRAQPQLDFSDSTFYQHSHTVFDNQPQSNVFLRAQSSTSIVIPLTPASAGNHNTSTIQAIQSVKRPRVRLDTCIGCRLKKKKCERYNFGLGETRCLLCIEDCIPLQICSQRPFKRFKIFEKWLDKIYEQQFTLVQSSNLCSLRTAELKHCPDGPFLIVKCCRFKPTAHYQTRALRKNSSGWHAAETTPFCLLNPKMDILSYVQECTPYFISEACECRDIVSPFFILADYYRNNSVIQHCFEMYTALCLIMKGCQFSGTRKERTGVDDDYLDMTRVEDRASAWFGYIPVPRMVTNQVNHQLELRMAELERTIMREVEDILESKKRRLWVIATLAVFLVEHIREIDAARNIFWGRYNDTLGFWIHPLKPQVLIEEAVISSNALLSAFHYTVGRKPLEINWDLQRSRDMVDNDHEFIKTIKIIQAYVAQLERDGMIGRRACGLYRDGNPKSVNFTVSSLLFAGITEGCEVKGLY